MSSTDFSRVPATQAPAAIKKYLDPSEELVFHRRFHIASLLEPLAVIAFGVIITSFADIAVRSPANTGRDVLVLLWVVWLAWALSAVWDYSTLKGFYTGSAVVKLVSFVVTIGVLVLEGYIGKTRGIGSVLWYTFFAFCLWAFLQTLRYLNRYMVLTQKRLMVVEGIINRQVKSLPLPKLTDMIYQRTGLGQALGYGTFDLQAPGASVNLTKMTYVVNPDNTYLQISHLLWGAANPPKPKNITLGGRVSKPDETGSSNISVTGQMDG